MAYDMTALVDLLNSTNPNRRRNQVTQTQTYRAHPLYRMIFGDDASSEVEDNGTQWERNMRVLDNNPGKDIGLFDTIAPNRRDMQITLRQPWWMHSNANYLVDRNEPWLNSGAAQINNELETLEDGTNESIFNRIEEYLALPRDNASVTNRLNSPLEFAGLVPSGQTDPTGGFNGTTAVYRDNSTTNLFGGQDRTSALLYRLRNYCATHDTTFGSVTRQQCSRMLEYMKYDPIPTGYKQNDGRMRVTRSFFLLPTDFRLQYENDVNRAAIESEMDGDLASYYGTKLMYRDQPLVTVPLWDNYSLMPILWMHTRWIFGVRIKGNWLNWHPAEKMPLGTSAYRECEVKGQLVGTNVKEGLGVIHAPR